MKLNKSNGLLPPFIPLVYGPPDKPQTMLWLSRGHISGHMFLIPIHVSLPSREWS